MFNALYKIIMDFVSLLSLMGSKSKDDEVNDKTVKPKTDPKYWTDPTNNGG